MKIRVVFSKDAEEVYKYLNKISQTSKLEKSIFNSINKKLELIKENPHFGQAVSKKKISADYVLKFNITNLFRVSLPNFWRMEYTLTNNDTEIEIIAFILDILNHKEYSKKHKYK
jgi:mRNA-degrading endonuclease RelE of RelBE toxin-antitoxin system